MALNCWLFPLLLALTVSAQGVVQPQILNTGNSVPLARLIVDLLAPTSTNDHIIFELGFATDEVFAPGNFFDSFTVSVQPTGGVQMLILATLDAGGNVVAPGGGGLVIDPAAISRNPVAFPSLTPVLASKSAFFFSVPVLPDLLGAPLRVFFDLFDNLDSVASLGYFSGVALVSPVPEPQTWVVLALGVGMLGWGRRRG